MDPRDLARGPVDMRPPTARFGLTNPALQPPPLGQPGPCAPGSGPVVPGLGPFQPATVLKQAPGTGTQPFLPMEDTSLAVSDEEEHDSDDLEAQEWFNPYETDYTHHAFLAFRVAIGTLCIVSPLLIEPGTLAWIDELRERGIVKRMDIAMFLYTVYLTTGDTIALAWSTMAGTFMSVFNMWLLQGIFPGGYQEDSPDWVFWCIVLNGAAYLFLVLYLDVATNTRIFALASYVFHIMACLNPYALKDRSHQHRFQIDFTGHEVCEFKAATIGCMLAVLTTMIPQPIWASKSVGTTSERLVQELDFIWRECSKSMCGYEVDNYVQDSVSKGMKYLNTDLQTLTEQGAVSHWEQFGRPLARSRRLMLLRLRDLLVTSYDDICCVWENCQAETYGDLHNRFMGIIQEPMNNLIKEAGEVFLAATRTACKGYVDKHNQGDLLLKSKRTREALAVLTARFLEAKVSLQQDSITEELIDETSFCMNLCTYGRTAAEYAEALVDHSTGKNPFPEPQSQCCNCEFTKDRWNFAMRNWITIFLGMFIGWHGYYERFRPYDAGVACTLAILLSEYSGSAMTKNLQRIQGVVIGTVFGQLVHALLGWCTWWGYTLLLMFNFFWTWLTFFIYFHIPTWSTIALLISVFGTSNMIGANLREVGCVSGAVSQDKLFNTYYDIVNVCTALFLGAGVDMVLGWSAKARAARTLLEAWRDITQAIQTILDPKDPTTRVRSTDISGKIDSARSLGTEAAQELSIFTSEWRSEDFAFALEGARKLRIFLDSLEFTAAKGVDGGQKDPDFLRATELSAFGPVRERLFSRMELVEELLEDLVPVYRWRHAQQKEGFSKMASLHWNEGRFELQKFLAEAKTVPWEATTDYNLENDGPSQVCSLLAGVQAMYREIREVHRRLRPMENSGDVSPH